jgi:hypothetical protein
MATKLIHKKSSVIEKVPLTTDIEVGEIAINLADRKLFTKDASDNIISLGNTEESRLPIKADVALSKGDVLYATGTVGASGKISVNKFTANNTIEELYLVGVAEKDFALGDTGFAVTFGEIQKINTTGSTVSQTWTDGTILYSSPTTAGKLTSVKPTAPNQSISVAIVVRAHATTGILFVRPIAGFHLDELHNILITTPLNNQVLTYETASGVWKNKDQTPTNLSLGVSSGTAVQIDSSTGTDVLLPIASVSAAGIVNASTQTFGGAKTFNANVQLSRALVENVSVVTDGASVDLSPNNGTIQRWTLAASRTPVLPTDWPAGSSMTLMIADGTAYSITWTTMAPVWVGGTAPNLAATGWTTIVFWKVGTTIYGARVGDSA